MKSLVGAWEMVSYTHVPESGKVYYPFGESPKGRILYTESGFMSVSIARDKRTHFADSRPFNGTDKEKIAAFESYLSYFGRYEISGNKVIHAIEVSSFPNWVGTRAERFFEFDEKGNLIFSTATYISSEGTSERAYITWKRIS